MVPYSLHIHTPTEYKVTGTSSHCSPPALEAPREENPGKFQPGAVRGFEPPPAASHDGELATGPKARPRKRGVWKKEAAASLRSGVLPL